MLKSVDIKNVRWWEWLIVAFVVCVIFFPGFIVKVLGNELIEENSLPEGKRNGRKWWQIGITVVCTLLGPVGGAINEIGQGAGWWKQG